MGWNGYAGHSERFSNGETLVLYLSLFAHLNNQKIVYRKKRLESQYIQLRKPDPFTEHSVSTQPQPSAEPTSGPSPIL
jgi:hypothetical protein